MCVCVRVCVHACVFWGVIRCDWHGECAVRVFHKAKLTNQNVVAFRREVSTNLAILHPVCFMRSPTALYGGVCPVHA